jgi:PKD repeat protein
MLERVDDVDIEDCVVQVVITESNIAEVWGGGCMTELDHVNREMVPDEDGTAVVLSDEQQTIDLTFTLDSGWDEDNIELVVFIQDNDSKEIHQAVKSMLDELQPAIFADFYAADTLTCEGNSISYSDNSVGDVVSWEWEFDGGTPGTSSLENPTVVYNTTGNYDVTLTVSDGNNEDEIEKSDYITVSGSVPQTPNIPDGASELCENQEDTEYETSGSPNAILYEWVLAPSSAGEILNNGKQQISINWDDTFTGNATVKVKAVNGCGESDFSENLDLIFNDNPEVYTVTGGGISCQGSEGVEVGLSDSDPGIEYGLYKNDVYTGDVIVGTGEAISFGLIDEAGYYTIIAIDIETDCSIKMASTANVTVRPVPIIYTITGGGDYCEGTEGVVVGLDDSEDGVDYELFCNDITTGTTVEGTGEAISFGTCSQQGFYTIIATEPLGYCSSDMDGEAQVSMLAAPQIYNISGGGMYCEGDAGVNINLDNSDSGIDYELYVDDAATGNILEGTGTAITFENITQVGICTIIGKDAETLCAVVMNNSAEITMISNPVAFNITGGGSYCEGTNGAEIGLNGSEEDITYELYYNDTPTGNTITGNGDPVSFGYQTGVGDYTVNATESQFACSMMMTGSASISMISLPGVPGMPSGPDQVDINITPTTQYTATLGSNADASEWELNPGAAGSISIINNTTCEIVWDVQFEGIATLKVRGLNTCGESGWTDGYEITVYNTVGFSDPQNDLGLKISPNPSSGIFTIQLSSGKQQVVSLSIYNSLNNIVYKQDKIEVNGNFKQTFEMTNLPAGVYFVRLDTKDSTIVRKLVIQ